MDRLDAVKILYELPSHCYSLSKNWTFPVTVMVLLKMAPMGPRGLGPIKKTEGRTGRKDRAEGPGGRTGRKDRAEGPGDTIGNTIGNT